MPSIPGLTDYGTIPRLGQGSPGGRVGTTGLPGGPSESNIPGLPTLSAIPRVGAPLSSAPVIPSPSLVNRNTAALDSSASQHTKQRLDAAMQILMRVHTGQLDATRAAKMLDDLSPEERQTLTRTVLNNHARNGGAPPTDELKALRYLPLGKAAGETAPLDPTHKTGFGTNLLRDAVQSVVNLPAGLALTGKAIGSDIGDVVTHPLSPHPFQGGTSTHGEFERQIADPIGKSYAQTYGPLVHGDFGEFSHQFQQHPLGPILDVATLFSGGLGAAGRAAEATSALRAGAVTRDATGLAKVGDRFTVQPLKNGTFGVREGNNYVAHNLPDEASAIKHAQSLQPFGSSPTKAFLKGGGERGRLIDRYEAARGFNHDQEIQQTMKEVSDVLDNSNLRVDRRSFKQVLSEVKGDLTRTAIQDRNLPARIAQSNIGFLQSAPVRGTLAAGQIALREASDLVRAGAIYLRPAYLPNNWAGNLFMNSVHQGVLAPVNLAKSMVIDKYIGARYTAAMDRSMGQNAAEVVTAARGRGYVGSLTNPLAHSMGMIADQPFRRAAFLHEARRAGYSKLTDVKSLFDRAAAKDEKALRQIGEISRRAQEEIVKFGHMNDTEREVIRNLIFVYSWVRGASRYAARFPLQHPIQSDVFHHVGQDVGKPYVQRELGGVPSYLLGAIPVGHDKNGNPILINPFSLNPLGTGVDLGRAVAGTMKVIRGDKTFNKFADQDVANLTNPLVQSYLSAREGGKTPKAQLEQTIAPIRLVHDLQHPGSGSVFPTSRTEALGHYVVGAMFPRVADQAALQRSLEREQQFDPVARIPEEMKVYAKATGSPVPPDLEKFYRQDLVQVQTLKDFQHHYASSHGQSGYRNLPPANKVEAAIQFLRSHGYASDAEIAEYKKEAAQLTNDADLNSFANGLFSTTGIGQYKLVWDQMMRDAKGLRLSRKRG